MVARARRLSILLAATCLTPLSAQALDFGSDPSAIAGITPGMRYQEFHEALDAQGFVMIPGQSIAPGANLDVTLEDGTVVANAFGYGAEGGDRFVYVETVEDQQGGRTAIRVTGIYSFAATEFDHEAADRALEAKFGGDFSCYDPSIGIVFQYDADMQQLGAPDCSVLHPLLAPMPRDLVMRSLEGDDWSFTATGVKTEHDGKVTLIESVQDNLAAAEANAAALGIEIPSAPTPQPVATSAPEPDVATEPGTIDGFISVAEIGPMPAFQGLEFGMPLGEALAMLEAEGFQYRESFIPDAYRMRLYPDPVWYDTTMDIAFMPYPQSVVQELQGKEPPVRFKGFMAHRKNADGSIDTAGASIVQAVERKDIDLEAPLLRLYAARVFPTGQALPIMDWLNAIRAPGQKFEGGCIEPGTGDLKLFTKDGKITGRPHDDADSCWEWELVHEHRYRALLMNDIIQDQSVTGGRKLKKIEVLIDDHQAIEEALRR